MGNGAGKQHRPGKADSDYVLEVDEDENYTLDSSIEAEISNVTFEPTTPVLNCINILVGSTCGRRDSNSTMVAASGSRAEVEKKLTNILHDWFKLHHVGHRAFCNAAIFDQAQWLASVSNQLDESWQDFLIRRMFPEVFVSVWKCVSLRQSYKPRGTFRPKYVILNMLKEITANLTRLGKDLCMAIGQTEAIALIIQELNHPLFDEEALASGPETTLWDSTRETLRRTLTILVNLIRTEIDMRPMFRTEGACEALMRFESSRFHVIRARALFSLWYLVDVADSKRLSATNDSLKFMVEILRSCLEAENHFSEDHDFSASEAAYAILLSAANDDNKYKLVHVADILPHLTKMLQEGNSEEQTLAAKSLWTLAFHQDNKSIMRDDSDLMKALFNVRKSGDKSLRQACTGVFWEIGMGPSAFHSEAKNKEQESQDANAEVPVDDDAPHVMISYQWDVQQRVLHVRDLLKENGYRVWMDVDNMGGSTLEAMAAAVEKAAVVLICFTEKYKLSASCRSEAEYTYKLHKPVIPLRLQEDYNPDGWLGIIIGTKLYFDLTLPDFDGEIRKVVKELGDRGKTGSAAVRETHQNTSASAETSGLSLKRQSTNLPLTANSRKENLADAKVVIGWSESDVTNWLTSHKLGHLSSRLRGYDGAGLLGLKGIASGAPEFFYKTLRQEMGFKKMLEIVQFKNALDGIV